MRKNCRYLLFLFPSVVSTQYHHVFLHNVKQQCWSNQRYSNRYNGCYTYFFSFCNWDLWQYLKVDVCRYFIESDWAGDISLIRCFFKEAYANISFSLELANMQLFFSWSITLKWNIVKVAVVNDKMLKSRTGMNISSRL